MEKNPAYEPYRRLAAPGRPFGLRAEPNDPTASSRLMGNWLAASGNIDVEIAPCDAASGDTGICGTITRVLHNDVMDGSAVPATAHNDAGLRILIDFAPAGGDTFRGRMLNRQSGKVSDCILRPGKAGEMVVHPYVILPWFGQIEVWHRQT